MVSVTNQLNQTLNQQVLAILERCNHINHLKQLQSFLTTLGQSQTNFYAFKLVRFCTLKLSNLTYARFIFDHLTTPNTYLYTAMITAYASEPVHASSAFSLYRDMVRRGQPQPNHFIYPHVLKSCPDVLESRGTKMVHTQIVISGFEQYPVVETALVNSYSRSGNDIGIARKLFDEMSERNVVSWTAMISGYTRVGDIKNAASLFESMPDRDVPAWNSVIAGCTQNGLFSDAISFFRRMGMEESDNIRPNKVTLVCALSAIGHTGMLQLGKVIHGYVYRNGLDLDSFISNALIDMYGKCGSLKEARRVFDRNSKKRLTSWNSMINSFALHGQSENSICVFEEMMRCQDQNIRPDGVTFISLLNACTHGGLVELGRAYFKLMTKTYRIEPQIEHYGCLVDLLGRAGRFEEALEVVKGMKIEPDEVVWGSLLNGCKIYGRTDFAEFAVKKLIEIDPNNGGYGIMLANIYGELGKWDEVRKVRKMLKDRNAYKTPGCSWIEVDKQVHQFHSLDKTHPRTEEIYDALESLTNFYAFKLVRFCTLKLWNLTSARLIFDNLTTPVTSLYTAMVSAYASQPVHLSCTATWVGDITKAALLFEAMPDRDAAARKARRVSDRKSKKCLALWNSLTKSFARHGQCENAISVFEEMMQSADYLLMKIEPDDVVWGSLFDGCKIHHGTDLAQFAVKILIEIDNMIYSIMLVNLYGELGKWDEVGKVRKMFKRLVMPIKNPVAAGLWLTSNSGSLTKHIPEQRKSVMPWII
ncbi:hypothetical protein WN944_015476 [Citrus x changshan-huyou]|uniref:Pentatricopeptide repeat-containing protein n=1 Tax=Citrus x changshan-huyou TaxID=2935761 RepID=A0AAP0M919_9ROSI